jgi:adenosylmethionine-8-amino-7-oxononanoate aminotransferase
MIVEYVSDDLLVIQVSPPLICDQSHFDEMEQILRSVLTEAATKV